MSPEGMTSGHMSSKDKQFAAQLMHVMKETAGPPKGKGL